jgi:hypothetical protein
MAFGAPYGAVKLLKGSETAPFQWPSHPRSTGRPCITKITGRRTFKGRCKTLSLFAAKSSDPDTFHYGIAMKQPDRAEFIKAMKEEVNAHTENGHWELLPCSAVPDGIKVLDSVWAFRRKRRIATQEVYKWKARLNVHGGQQEKGVNFWETYAPVVQWVSIRIFLIVALINGWHSRQLDFVLAYPQADIECDLYMAISAGFSVNGNRKDYVLKL